MNGNLFIDESEYTWVVKSPEDLPDGFIGLDLETRDDGIEENKGAGWAWGGGYVVGVAVSWQSGREKRYYPVGHQSGTNLPEKLIFEWLKRQFQNPRIIWCFAHATYDLGWIAQWSEQLGLPKIYPIGRILDCLVMAPLLNEYRQSYSLDSIARTYIGRGKDEALLKKIAAQYGVSPKGGLYLLPPAAVGPYGEQDASITVETCEVLLKEIEMNGLQEPCNLEHDLIPVLLDMRYRGIPVNLDKAVRLKDLYRSREKEAIALVKKISGVAVDPWDAVSISRALAYEGIQTPETAKGHPSVTKELLAGWVDSGSKVAGAVASARKWQKAYGTFLDGQILTYAKNIRGEWRVFPENAPLRSEREGSSFGTVSYRFSCTNPGMQLLPGRDGELTRDIRGCFEAEKGELWHAPDYSQQEPRMVINFAAGYRYPNGNPIPGALEAAEAIRTTPKWDFHDQTAEITGILRKYVKTISLGRMYGMGDGKMAVQLGLPYEEKIRKNGKPYLTAGAEAQEIIDTYDREMPWVKAMAEVCTKRAEDKGQIKLLGGYIARFKGGNQTIGDFPHKALNRLGQGSGAAQTKRAMVDAYRAGVRLNVTQHDELGCTGSPDEGETLAKCMENAFADRLRIPFRVDRASGKDWGEAATK